MPVVSKTTKARKAAEKKVVAPVMVEPVVEEEEEEEQEEFADGDDEEGIAFDDVYDNDEEEEEEGDDEINEFDDFETKAEKYRRQVTKLGAAAAQEAVEDTKRDVAPRVFTAGEDDDGEAAEEDAQAPLAGMQHSDEELKDRVNEVVRILSNFRTMREEGHTREDYLAILRRDLMELYEYNDFLMEVILELFPPHEAVQFLEAMEKERPVTLRTNTIKAKRRDLVQQLTKRGMHVEPLEKWSKVGLQVFESNVPITGTVEYLAGHYMSQSAASFLPVMALAPQENERVLDMSAAPGGKTTYICQLMKNTGVVFANDVSATRSKALNANIQRLGISNCLTTNYDGVGYDKIMKNFDRVLLDAPCTGTGVISRDKSIKTSKSSEDILKMSQLQRRLLVSAIDCVNANSPTGGYVVYSTCSFTVEEDEAVIDYALRARHVEVVPMGLPFGRPGMTKYRRHRFNAQVAEARRFFPHVHNLDGFFVCKLRKIKDGVKNEEAEFEPEVPEEEEKKTAKPNVVGRKPTEVSAGIKRARPTATIDDGKSAAVSPAEPKLSTSKVSRPPSVSASASSVPKRRATKANRSERGRPKDTAVRKPISKGDGLRRVLTKGKKN